MILIADSGSTKCTWAYCSENGEIISMHSAVGFNPKYSSYSDISDELNQCTLLELKEKVTEVYFYGAGCSSDIKNIIIEKPLQDFFSNARVSVRHDLEAALKATYKGSPIISCILGTGF